MASRIAATRPGLVLLLLAALAGCASAPPAPEAPAAAQPAPAAPAATPASHSGVLEGAPYLIEVPPRWNGELVMFLHGYEPKGAPRETPLVANDFDRWLLLFEKTAREIFDGDVAEAFIIRARRIADSFEMGIATARGWYTSTRRSRSRTRCSIGSSACCWENTSVRSSWRCGRRRPR